MSGRVQQPQTPGGERGQKFLGARHLQRIQVILDAQGGEEVALDLQLAAEVRIGQRQRIVSEHRRPNGFGAAEYECKSRVRTRCRVGPGADGRAVPQSQAEHAGIAAKQPLQEQRCLVAAPIGGAALKPGGPRCWVGCGRSAAQCGFGVHLIIHIDTPDVNIRRPSNLRTSGKNGRKNKTSGHFR